MRMSADCKNSLSPYIERSLMSRTQKVLTINNVWLKKVWPLADLLDNYFLSVFDYFYKHEINCAV